MALFDLFKRSAPATESTAQNVEETRSLADPEPWLFELFGATPVTSGVSVTPSTAMRCTPVRAAVEAISEGVGDLPIHVYRRDGDGRERAPEHPAYALLHDQANEWVPAGLFREQITRDALLHGNGYAFINRRDGEPVELIRLPPTAVSVDLDRVTAEPTYKHAASGSAPRIIDRRDILHIAAPSIDGVKGESPVTACREAIGVNLAIEKHVGRLFANKGRVSGFLKLPVNLNPDAKARQRESWRTMEEEGGTALLDKDTEYQQLGMSPADLQALQLWQHSINEIARVFRVPPHMMFELGRATWGNAGEMGATFLKFTLSRWLKVWQGEIRLKLIAPEDRANFYAEFLVDDLLRSDLTARATAYQTLISARVLNPNEVRAMENRAPYEGGDEFINPNTTSATTPPNAGASLQQVSKNEGDEDE